MAKTFTVFVRENKIVAERGLPCMSNTNILYLNGAEKFPSGLALVIDANAYFDGANVLASGGGRRWIDRVSASACRRTFLAAAQKPDQESAAVVLLAIGKTFGDHVTCFAREKIASGKTGQQENAVVILKKNETANIRVQSRSFLKTTHINLVVHFDGNGILISLR